MKTFSFLKDFFVGWWNFFVSFGIYKIERQEKLVEKYVKADTEKEKESASAELGTLNFYD